MPEQITYRGVPVPDYWVEGLPDRSPSEPSEFGLLGFIDGVDLALNEDGGLLHAVLRCPGQPECDGAGLPHRDHPWLRGTEILCCPGDTEEADDAQA